jgi:hypothetical protein
LTKKQIRGGNAHLPTAVTEMIHDTPSFFMPNTFAR